LALAVVLALGPSGRGVPRIARAQDDTAVERVSDDDRRPDHAGVEDGPPGAPGGAPSKKHRAGARSDAAAQTDPAAAPTSQPVGDPARAPAAAGPAGGPAPDPLGSSLGDPPAAPAAKPAGNPVVRHETSPERDPAAGSRRAPPVPRAARAHKDETCTADQGAAYGASFGKDDRLVMTYYYYWYDQASIDDPALTLRPPPDPPMDWRSVSWHERQLADMASAGIDVALAVYWGDTSVWSVDALTPMIQAREHLLAAGLRPPAIGLFFDTNMYAMILPERPDLADFATDDGLAMLGHQIGTFFDQVPPCHRARVDGRPLVFFWRADTEDGDHFTFDDRTFAGLNDLVAREYGERIHLVLEHSWQAAARKSGFDLGAAELYRWGAALNGPRFQGRTVAVGPGYDDRLIDGRPGYTRERVDGATYSRDLRSAVLSGTTWLLLETWNELWEGTAIAETEENGRTYLGITARYTALFHQLANERASDGWFDLGRGENAYLRRLADAPVEQGMPAEERGRPGARPFREDDDGTGYFHFAIDRRLGLDTPRPLTVQVEYFDEGDGAFALEYDSLDPDAPAGGAYKVAEPVPFEDTRTWRSQRFDLADASLLARQYDGVGDFRIHDVPGTDDRLHVFGRVTVTAQPASRPVPSEPETLTFVEPSPKQPITLRWAEAEPAAAYLVTVQPFDDADGDGPHGFTSQERRRCDGESEVGRGQESRGLARAATCELRLARDLDDGVYRWRVQALDAGGATRGEPSDWAFLVVARR
jgi:hypothetical protein